MSKFVQQTDVVIRCMYGVFFYLFR